MTSIFISCILLLLVESINSKAISHDKRITMTKLWPSFGYPQKSLPLWITSPIWQSTYRNSRQSKMNDDNVSETRLIRNRDDLKNEESKASKMNIPWWHDTSAKNHHENKGSSRDENRVIDWLENQQQQRKRLLLPPFFNYLSKIKGSLDARVKHNKVEENNNDSNDDNLSLSLSNIKRNTKLELTEEDADDQITDGVSVKKIPEPESESKFRLTELLKEYTEEILRENSHRSKVRGVHPKEAKPKNTSTLSEEDGLWGR